MGWNAGSQRPEVPHPSGSLGRGRPSHREARASRWPMRTCPSPAQPKGEEAISSPDRCPNSRGRPSKTQAPSVPSVHRPGGAGRCTEGRRRRAPSQCRDTVGRGLADSGQSPPGPGQQRTVLKHRAGSAATHRLGGESGPAGNIPAFLPGLRRKGRASIGPRRDGYFARPARAGPPAPPARPWPFSSSPLSIMRSSIPPAM